MKNKIREVIFRIPDSIRSEMLNDLRRPHPFAAERVGFLYTKSKTLSDNSLIILAFQYSPISDKNYIDDPTVGARINSVCIREAMENISQMNSGCFHVHLHDHEGRPSPSYTDRAGIPGVVESFCHNSRSQLNGFLIISKTNFYVSIAEEKRTQLIQPSLISAIGRPLTLNSANFEKGNMAPYERQSFLGSDAHGLFGVIKVGIAGYGGGGSHIGQQLAHIGVKNITVFDQDIFEESNLNRLIGSWHTDVRKKTPKVDIARRTIRRIFKKSQVTPVLSRWQENPEALQKCDIVFGCVDSYAERQQLEAECRRYLIPYIDIGMDIYTSDVNSYSMVGQVILSMPGHTCMNCYGYLTAEKLAEEAKKYGQTGGRPQVIWPNGVLASTAVGIFVDLVTGWTKQDDPKVYFEYDGNRGYLKDHIRKSHSPNLCEHYSIAQVGPPEFLKL